MCIWIIHPLVRPSHLDAFYNSTLFSTRFARNEHDMWYDKWYELYTHAPREHIRRESTNHEWFFGHSTGHNTNTMNVIHQALPYLFPSHSASYQYWFLIDFLRLPCCGVEFCCLLLITCFGCFTYVCCFTQGCLFEELWTTGRCCWTFTVLPLFGELSLECGSDLWKQSLPI